MTRDDSAEKKPVKEKHSKKADKEKKEKVYQVKKKVDSAEQQ